MAELSEFRFFLFVSLIIFPAQALKVYLANSEGDFNYQTDISFTAMNGIRVYNDSPSISCDTKNSTWVVVLYIISSTRFAGIMLPRLYEKRMEIARELIEKHDELFYLGVEDFVKQRDDNVIRDFISATIKHPRRLNLLFNTVGNIKLVRTRVQLDLTEETYFKEYTDDPTLRQRLESIKIKSKLSNLFAALKKGK